MTPWCIFYVHCPCIRQCPITCQQRMSLHSGQKLFFPNIIFRLVRSNLPPNQALFRIPRNVNKLDVKAYLKAIYDVDVTDVRTANYLSKKTTDIKVSTSTRRATSVRTPAFKRAIVTMTKDFVFPPVPKIGDNGVQPLPPQNLVGVVTHVCWQLTMGCVLSKVTHALCIHPALTNLPRLLNETVSLSSKE